MNNVYLFKLKVIDEVATGVEDGIVHKEECGIITAENYVHAMKQIEDLYCDVLDTIIFLREYNTSWLYSDKPEVFDLLRKILEEKFE